MRTTHSSYAVIPTYITLFFAQMAFLSGRNGRFVPLPITDATYAAAATRARAHCDQISDRAETNFSISASEWTGDGVMRKRSVPRGTVG